ncbi:ubiquitin carboxyl-terminal hydrolase 44-like [Mya arenaria]|uniref:ubiquitin carboxyl-terminal hydrolase 44-like n=1 Tax=Mya arenaria TaxID=6604 RepID=UPI0022E3E833|nr:ubiquitin carboxyl-terminal hydrolase 44-like [Mya arenaria]
MEKCVHVSKIRPAWDHSILIPEKWLCYICRTTESVWACLSCPNVACGRFNEKHALQHYQESHHPISIEVNEKYVYCYVCDDYVMNDNAAGDIKLLRTALSAIATQKFTHIDMRGKRLLRSYSHSGVVQRDTADETDKLATADWHFRQRLLAHVFSAWRNFIRHQKLRRKPSPGQEATESRVMVMRRTIIPGVTGLRNLGNTCYMNSVLQVLSHIEAFRDYFLKMNYSFDASPDGSPHVKHVPPASTKSSPSGHYTRQSTIDCFQHLMSSTPSVKKRQSGGLNGGSTVSTPVKSHLICNVESQSNKGTNVSLCGELHGLFRVLWSGKWAQVSPHAFLRAVWQAIPMFKGYAQHDAQEFLCELLDKVQQELDSLSPAPKLPPTPGQRDTHFLSLLFQGQLVSRVICQSCGNESETFEPYMDLSLEFPDRYQITKQNARVAEDICHITEMLAKFTEVEHLEGNIYACEKCNKNRRKSSTKLYSEATKQLLINKLPPVLRLHLKRFRWSGRTHREKISTHVATDEKLDLGPFCSGSATGSKEGADEMTTAHYQLFGVIIHHGKGFGSGHYTAYTWNKEARSWVNCNDSRMILSSLEEVLTAQAYILFYHTVGSDAPSIYPTTPISRASSMHSLKSEATDILSDSEEVPVSVTASDCLLSMPIMDYCQSQSSGGTEKYSLKVDGTQTMTDSSSVDTSVSSASDSSLHIVNGEIPFMFNDSPGVSHKNETVSTIRNISSPLKMKTSGSSKTRSGRNSSLTRGKRRISDSQSDGNEPSNPKKARKLSFGASVFYTSPKRDGSGRKLRRSLRLIKLNQGFAKLDDILAEKSSNEEESEKHIKRRKSTFW